MLQTFKAVFRNGQIQISEDHHIPEGSEILVTVLDGEHLFWIAASESALSTVWDNAEDDIYGQLLEG